LNPKENGKRLRALRLARGISAATLADEIGVTESAVFFYEAGERTPRDDKKVAIAKFFGVPVAEVFFADEATNSC
jgi:transcriptional regulator with XRE-family HTH domain